MNDILVKLIQFSQVIGLILIGVMTVMGTVAYPGQIVVYLFFSLLSLLLLVLGFTRRAIFFDSFIGVFFFLGFWLKLTVTVVFFEGQFDLYAGRFDGSPAAFDQALFVPRLLLPDC